MGLQGSIGGIGPPLGRRGATRRLFVGVGASKYMFTCMTPADATSRSSKAGRPAAAPTPRKATGARQAEIADAALRIIGEQGARALTAATLGEAVGITPGALYRHFASLDEILAAAVDRAVTAVEATFPSLELSPLDRLRELTTERVALIRRTPGLAWLLLSDQVHVTVPAPAVKRLRDLVTRSRAFLREAVKAAQADDSLRADLEPAVVLTLLSGTVHALAGGSGVHAGPPRGPAPARVLAALFELLAPTSPGESS